MPTIESSVSRWARRGAGIGLVLHGLAHAVFALRGSAGTSGVGAVVGATEPRHIARLRELMPEAIFLLPGVGAQGGTAAELGAAFRAGPASALVTASRSIAGSDDPAGAAETLREQVWDVACRARDGR